jgi:hypothetical protein
MRVQLRYGADGAVMYMSQQDLHGSGPEPSKNSIICSYASAIGAP